MFAYNVPSPWTFFPDTGLSARLGQGAGIRTFAEASGELSCASQCPGRRPLWPLTPPEGGEPGLNPAPHPMTRPCVEPWGRSWEASPEPACTQAGYPCVAAKSRQPEPPLVSQPEPGTAQPGRIEQGRPKQSCFRFMGGRVGVQATRAPTSSSATPGGSVESI